jgi:GT2 family glycosyltransferase
MRTLVIIPAFNEHDALPDTLAELWAHHPTLDVVVVSDRSVDRTAEVARDAGGTVLELPFNLGIGGALHTDFLHVPRRARLARPASRCCRHRRRARLAEPASSRTSTSPASA